MTSLNRNAKTMYFRMIIVASFALQIKGNLLQISVDPESQRLIDTLGREVLIHGTNIVIKHFPWHPNPEGFGNDIFSEQDMALIKSLGLNGVRLGMMWQGLMAERGKFNETYLKIMEGFVQKAAKYGIYILLDMHQNVMSSRFCGEGFPNWAIDPDIAKNFPYPLHKPYKLDPSTNLPTPEDCARFSSSTYYLAKAVGKSFQNLYMNVDGLRDEWAKFWVKTAQTFKFYTNVLGYELINEPWPGDIYKNPFLLEPTVADKQYLSPVYDNLAKAIRTVDKDHCIFFEPVTWANFGAGFDHVPGGENYQNKSVLSYHFYVPPNFDVDLDFMERMKDIEKLKCGGMLTEFATQPKGCPNLMFKIMNRADYTFQSWLGWEYYSSKRSTPLSSTARIYNTSRTYPQAVAGHVIDLSFNHQNNHFHVLYQITDTCLSKTTIIYLNEKLHYPHGYDVTIQSTGLVMWFSKVSNYIEVEHSYELIPGDNVLVQIKPKIKEHDRNV
ncbi:endoglycoceramidase-like [Xenia sp. Carnegie-2017]|uniref:endoglycoceramidase-like n=1 Tax=Xenia sp. Carnegie-2017 TaxID=2897299 RepID=UPI001F038182|nr:endoglycoceramidase-like [Xenia sp. Carnegie-2017]